MDELIRRVGALESDVRDVKAILGRLEPAIQKQIDQAGKVAESVAEMRGKLSQMPTTLQLILFIIAVLGIAGMTKIFS